MFDRFANLTDNFDELVIGKLFFSSIAWLFDNLIKTPICCIFANEVDIVGIMEAAIEFGNVRMV